MEFKLGDEVHWENYVDWVEGKIIHIEKKIRPDDYCEYCEYCGTLLKKNGEEYTLYTFLVERQKLMERQKLSTWSMIGREFKAEAKELRPVPFSGITIQI